MKAYDLNNILEKFKQQISEVTRGNKATFPEKVTYNNAIDILEQIIEQQKLDNEIRILKGLQETKEEW